MANTNPSTARSTARLSRSTSDRLEIEQQRAPEASSSRKDNGKALPHAKIEALEQFVKFGRKGKQEKEKEKEMVPQRTTEARPNSTSQSTATMPPSAPKATDSSGVNHPSRVSRRDNTQVPHHRTNSTSSQLPRSMLDAAQASATLLAPGHNGANLSPSIRGDETSPRRSTPPPLPARPRAASESEPPSVPMTAPRRRLMPSPPAAPSVHTRNQAVLQNEGSSTESPSLATPRAIPAGKRGVSMTSTFQNGDPSLPSRSRKSKSVALDEGWELADCCKSLHHHRTWGHIYSPRISHSPGGLNGVRGSIMTDGRGVADSI